MNNNEGVLIHHLGLCHFVPMNGLNPSMYILVILNQKTITEFQIKISQLVSKNKLIV